MKRLIVLLLLGIVFVPKSSFAASQVLMDHFSNVPAKSVQDGHHEYKYLLKCYQDGNMILNENIREAPSTEVVGDFLYIRTGGKEVKSTFAVISLGTTCFVEYAD